MKLVPLSVDCVKKLQMSVSQTVSWNRSVVFSPSTHHEHAALKVCVRFIARRLCRVPATFVSRLTGTFRSGCSGTTPAGLACAVESSAPTHEPLGLHSKSNRKCSRKPNKVILMMAIFVGLPQHKLWNQSLRFFFFLC